MVTMRPKPLKNNKSSPNTSQILNLLIGFSIVFVLGVLSLFLYDIEDLEETHDGGKRRQQKRTINEIGDYDNHYHNNNNEMKFAFNESLSSSSLTSTLTNNIGSTGIVSNFEVPDENKGFNKYEYKIYIYEDIPEALNADLRKRAKNSCNDGGYTNAEWKIPELIAKSDVYTPDAELADLYVVPLFPECYVRDKLQKGGVDYVTAVRKLNKIYGSAIDRIVSNYPYWKRSEGRDHVFIFPTEKGVENVLTEKTFERIEKSIKIVGVPTKPVKGRNKEGGSSNTNINSDSVEKKKTYRSSFNPFRDIVIPPIRDFGDEAYAIVNKKAEMENVFSSTRKTRIHFRGKVVSDNDDFFSSSSSSLSSSSSTVDITTTKKKKSSIESNIRKLAYEQLNGLKNVNVAIDVMDTNSIEENNNDDNANDDNKQSKKSQTSLKAQCDRRCVLQEMRNAETCLITPHGGVEGWSTALSDSILSGCVPIVILDEFEPYFTDVLNWEDFSYKVQESAAITDAKEHLLESKSVSITREKRQKALKIAARASVWNEKSSNGDAFDALLESLRKRVRFHRNSPYRFYIEADRNG